MNELFEAFLKWAVDGSIMNQICRHERSQISVNEKHGERKVILADVIETNLESRNQEFASYRRLLTREPKTIEIFTFLTNRLTEVNVLETVLRFVEGFDRRRCSTEASVDIAARIDKQDRGQSLSSTLNDFQKIEVMNSESVKVEFENE